MTIVTVSRILRILCATFFIGCSYPLSTFPLKYQPGVRYRYDYTSETIVNSGDETSDVQGTAQRNVGFKLSAFVDVTPVWASNGILLVKLEMSEARLASESRSGHESEWRSLGQHVTYFQWESGRVVRVYLSDDDPTLSANIKKGVIDMFQLRMDDGIHSEVDVSGECEVRYERLNEAHLRKVKTSCKSLYSAGTFQQVNPLLGVNVTSSLRTDYVISNDNNNNIIQSATTQESWASRVNMERRLAANVRTTQKLVYKESKKSSVIKASSVDDVFSKLSKQSKSGFYATSLETTFERYACAKGKCPSLTELVSQHHDNLRDSMLGTSSAAESFSRLVVAFRSASTEDILSVLKDSRNRDILLCLIDAASAEQTPVSQSALMQLLNFNDQDNIALTERYLLATAFSTHPTEAMLNNLLELFNKDVPNVQLRESIAECLGAVVNTYRLMDQGRRASHKIVSEVERSMLKKLSGCSSSVECQLSVVRSLGNARLPDTAEVLCQLAVNSSQGSLSEAALTALSRFDQQLIHGSTTIQKSLRDIFYERYRGYETPVRTQALKLLLTSPVNFDDVANIASFTTDRWNTDYSLYIQARLLDAASRNHTIREFLKSLLSDIKYGNYDVLAPKGKSLAFTSLLADGDDVKATYEMYVENGRSGIMKRSGMDVNIISQLQTLPVYSFKLWAAGLEALLSDEVDESERDVDVTAGLGLELIGVELRPISFFSGQSGLMSALWNAPTELTPALQTNVLLQDHSERVHLSNGLIAELDILGVLSLSLDGLLSVSLWNKNAHSLIKNSGAMQVTGGLSISTPVLQSDLHFNMTSQSYIDFTTDVDFSDDLLMCLQMNRPTSTVRIEVTRTESCRGFKSSYQSRVSRSTKVNAMSYPLPGRNADNCRKLVPSIDTL